MSSALVGEVEARKQLTGTVLTLPGAALAELAASQLDLVWIDLEHAALGARDAQEMVLGAQAAGAYALVRLPVAERQLLAPMLDAGADGIVLADVRTAAEAVAAVERVVHAPLGSRGWGPRRTVARTAALLGPGGRPAVWAQIEHPEGVAAAERIAAVERIGALVVGAADLSFGLGCPLDFSAPRLHAAIAATGVAAQAAGVPFGVAGPLDLLPAAVCAGATIAVHATEARLLTAALRTVDGDLRRLLRQAAAAADAHAPAGVPTGPGATSRGSDV